MKQFYSSHLKKFDLNFSNCKIIKSVFHFEINFKQALYPLAVIGSSQLVKIGNKITKGRQYEWGIVSVENESHCDFVKLREMLLSTNMINLIDITHTKHYQLFRANRLKEIGFQDATTIDENENEEENPTNNDRSNNRSIMDVYNLKRAEMYEDIQKREFEIKEEFVQKVKDKETELSECEKEV